MRRDGWSFPCQIERIIQKAKKFQKRACVNDPFVVVYRHWGISAVGSAFEWHSKGRGFESHMLHFFFLQIWFIGRTLASQAGKAGSTPVICFTRPLTAVGGSNNCKGFFVCPSQPVSSHRSPPQFLCNFRSRKKACKRASPPAAGRSCDMIPFRITVPAEHFLCHGTHFPIK